MPQFFRFFSKTHRQSHLASNGLRNENFMSQKLLHLTILSHKIFGAICQVVPSYTTCAAILHIVPLGTT